MQVKSSVHPTYSHDIHMIVPFVPRHQYLDHFRRGSRGSQSGQLLEPGAGKSTGNHGVHCELFGSCQTSHPIRRQNKMWNSDEICELFLSAHQFAHYRFVDRRISGISEIHRLPASSGFDRRSQRSHCQPCQHRKFHTSNGPKRPWRPWRPWRPCPLASLGPPQQLVVVPRLLMRPLVLARQITMS